MPLTITHETNQAGRVVVLAGEADATNFTELANALFSQLPAGATRLMIDASALRYIDSMATRSVAQAARVLKTRQGRLTVLRPQPAVLKVLQMTGVTTLVLIQA